MNPTNYKVQLKAELRRRMFQLRSRMNDGERRKANRVIQKEVVFHLQPRWKTILIYLSMADEVETVPLIREFIHRGMRVCVPAYHSLRDCYFPSRLANPETDLSPGKHGILEPRLEIRTPMESFHLDAIFVPGLAFDRQGHRLGFGRGYFDRLCHGTRAIKIALAYQFQIVNAVETRPHDVPMDLILTEKEMIQCQKS